MVCKIRKRIDDIPKYANEKSWACDSCGALMFSVQKPRCRQEMLAKVHALHASAEAEADQLHLDDQVKP